MVMCFAPDCKHYSERESCRFFKFPAEEKERARWVKLIRRQDRNPSGSSRICSCHFTNVEKMHGPTLFEHNKNKRFLFGSPEQSKKKRISVSSTTVLQHTSESATEVQQASETEIQQTCPMSETNELPEPYVATTSSSSSSTVLDQAENYFLKQEVQQLTDDLKKLKMSFTFEHIADREDLVMLYTGLPSKDVFLALLDYLSNININYYSGIKVECIAPIDQLFLTLYKLKINTPYKDIAFRFNCSIATVSNIFITWVHLLHEAVYEKLLATVPSRDKNKACLPNCFSLFPNTRIILDCTEIYTETPNAIGKLRDMYSHYKHRITAKGLVGVAPNGVVTFVSKLYPGSTSDKKIVAHSGILNILEAGDLILADKSFLIGDIVPQGVSVNIPPFLTTPQFSPEQIKQTRNIAKARIHVERAIRRIKVFNILCLIPNNLIPMSTKIWQTCAALTNFQYPLIKEVEKCYKDTN